MQNNHCLYCGHEIKTPLRLDEFKTPAPSAMSSLKELILPDTDAQAAHRTAAADYTCANCGLTFDQELLDKELERLENQSAHSEAPEDRLTEEEALEAARQLINKCTYNDICHIPSFIERIKLQTIQVQVCGEALDLLFQHGFPLEHPLEFMIYRSVCQAGHWLMYSKSDLDTRYGHLDDISGNLQHIDYFLPADDPEKLYRTLIHIGEALLLLGSLSINCHTKEGDKYNKTFTDLTGRKRAAVLGVFAKRLESMQDAPHGTDYLKMALRLRIKALEQAQETSISVLLGIRGDALSHISHAERRQINEDIKRIREIIKQRDPSFVPDKLPVQPVRISPLGRIGCIFGMLFFIAALIWTVCTVPSAAKLSFAFANKLSSLSFLMNFGVKDGEIIGCIVYPLIFCALGFLYESRLQDQVLSALYKLLRR